MTRQNLALDRGGTAQRTSSFALHTCVGRRTGRRRHPVHPEMPAKSPACSAAVTPSDAPTSRRPTRLFDRPTVERKRERALSSRPLVCRLFDALDAQLTRNPFASQCVLVAVLACLSDVIAQLLEGSRLPTLDLTRTWRFAAFRALIATPIYLSWLSFMERCVEQRASASRLPSGVFVFLAFASGRHTAYGDASMFSTSAEANAPAALRAYYGAALADDFECEGELEMRKRLSDAMGEKRRPHCAGRGE